MVLARSTRPCRVARAHGSHRTRAALRHPRRADQRAELHQRLVVRPRRRAGARQDRARDRQTRFCPRPDLRSTSRREHALEHARDVRVHQLGAPLVGERAHRARRVRADARQRAQRVGVRREASLPRRARGRSPGAPARGGSAPARSSRAPPTPPSRARPRARHVVQRREGLEELAVARHDARHLRLLEHQLRDEDVVRIARPPPGQVAPVARGTSAAEARRTAARPRRGSTRGASLARVATRAVTAASTTARR